MKLKLETFLAYLVDQYTFESDEKMSTFLSGGPAEWGQLVEHIESIASTLGGLPGFEDDIHKQTSEVFLAVRELISNSLDAGAKNIKITLKPGQFIVQDDGEGVSLQCFTEAFSIPKLSGKSVQEGIGEFGLGVNAMYGYLKNKDCRITLSSKTANTLGFKTVYTYEGGERYLELKDLPPGHPTGTIIEVCSTAIDVAHCEAIKASIATKFELKRQGVDIVLAGYQPVEVAFNQNGVFFDPSSLDKRLVLSIRGIEILTIPLGAHSHTGLARLDLPSDTSKPEGRSVIGLTANLVEHLSSVIHYANTLTKRDEKIAFFNVLVALYELFSSTGQINACSQSLQKTLYGYIQSATQGLKLYPDLPGMSFQDGYALHSLALPHVRFNWRKDYPMEEGDAPGTPEEPHAEVVEPKKHWPLSTPENSLQGRHPLLYKTIGKILDEFEPLSALPAICFRRPVPEIVWLKRSTYYCEVLIDGALYRLYCEYSASVFDDKIIVFDMHYNALHSSYADIIRQKFIQTFLSSHYVQEYIGKKRIELSFSEDDVFLGMINGKPCLVNYKGAPQEPELDLYKLEMFRDERRVECRGLGPPQLITVLGQLQGYIVIAGKEVAYCIDSNGKPLKVAKFLNDDLKTAESIGKAIERDCSARKALSNYFNITFNIKDKPYTDVKTSPIEFTVPQFERKECSYSWNKSTRTLTVTDPGGKKASYQADDDEWFEDKTSGTGLFLMADDGLLDLMRFVETHGDVKESMAYTPLKDEGWISRQGSNVYDIDTQSRMLKLSTPKGILEWPDCPQKYITHDENYTYVTVGDQQYYISSDTGNVYPLAPKSVHNLFSTDVCVGVHSAGNMYTIDFPQEMLENAGIRDNLLWLNQMGLSGKMFTMLASFAHCDRYDVLEILNSGIVEHLLNYIPHNLACCADYGQFCKWLNDLAVSHETKATLANLFSSLNALVGHESDDSMTQRLWQVEKIYGLGTLLALEQKWLHEKTTHNYREISMYGFLCDAYRNPVLFKAYVRKHFPPKVSAAFLFLSIYTKRVRALPSLCTTRGNYLTIQDLMLDRLAKKRPDFGKPRRVKNPTYITRLLRHAILNQARPEDNLWVRELLQNSIDARRPGEEKCHINIQVALDPSGKHFVYEHCDDGIGMSLEEVKTFFCIPENSMKRGQQGMIGGRGVGVFTLYEGCERVLITTSKGDGTILYVEIQPIHKDDNITDLSVSYHEEGGEFQGTKVTRISPAGKTSDLNITQLHYHASVHADVISAAHTEITINDAPSNIVMQSIIHQEIPTIGEVVCYDITRDLESIVFSAGGLHVRDESANNFPLHPLLKNALFKDGGSMNINLPDTVELTRDRLDFENRSAFMKPFKDAYETLMLRVFMKKFLSGNMDYKVLPEAFYQRFVDVFSNNIQPAQEEKYHTMAEALTSLADKSDEGKTNHLDENTFLSAFSYVKIFLSRDKTSYSLVDLATYYRQYRVLPRLLTMPSQLRNAVESCSVTTSAPPKEACCFLNSGSEEPEKHRPENGTGATLATT